MPELCASTWAFVFVTYVATAATLWARFKNWRWLTWVSKPVASASFVALGYCQVGPGSTLGTTVLIALSLCFVGDVLLIPRAKAAFVVGILAFLSGHLAFVVALVLRGVDVSWVLFGLPVAVLIGTAVLRWLLPHVKTRMRVPVLSYIVVILAMALCSFGSFAKSGGWLVPVAACMFVASDIAVARERFVVTSIVNRLWGLPLYYSAQLILATAIAT